MLMPGVWWGTKSELFIFHFIFTHVQQNRRQHPSKFGAQSTRWVTCAYISTVVPNIKAIQYLIGWHPMLPSKLRRKIFWTMKPLQSLATDGILRPCSTDGCLKRRIRVDFTKMVCLLLNMCWRQVYIFNENVKTYPFSWFGGTWDCFQNLLKTDPYIKLRKSDVECLKLSHRFWTDQNLSSNMLLMSKTNEEHVFRLTSWWFLNRRQNQSNNLLLLIYSLSKNINLKN